MLLILITALSLSTSLCDNLLKNTSMWSYGFHKKCLQTIPHSAKHHETIAALLCGEKIDDPQITNALSQTSLIHIFIVSGSHLILIDEVLNIIKIPFIFRMLLLSFYSLAVGWQAPAVRALMGMGLKQLLKKKGLSFPPDLIVLLTGCLALLMFPSWWNSRSLLMSWCASLALSMVSVFKFKTSWTRIFASQVAIYLLMSAPLWGFGSLHPLSILYNFFLAPLVAYILMPVSFLSLFSSNVGRIFDEILIVLYAILPKLSDPILLTKSPLPSISILWLWVFGAHFIFHFYRLKQKQGRDL